MVMYREIVEYLLTSGASLLPHDTVTKRTPLHAAGNQFATLIGNKTHACLFLKVCIPFATDVSLQTCILHNLPCVIKSGEYYLHLLSCDASCDLHVYVCTALNGHTDCIRVMLRHVTTSTHIDCTDLHGRYIYRVIHN